MSLIAVVTPLSIYDGFSTRKTFLYYMFILGDITPVNMKNYFQHNVRKHREKIMVRSTSPWTSI